MFFPRNVEILMKRNHLKVSSFVIGKSVRINLNDASNSQTWLTEHTQINITLPWNVCNMQILCN